MHYTVSITIYFHCFGGGGGGGSYHIWDELIWLEVIEKTLYLICVFNEEPFGNHIYQNYKHRTYTDPEMF